MNINNIIDLIPKNPENEALFSIESITKYPPNKIRINCHLSHEFRLFVEINAGIIEIKAEKRFIIKCTKNNFISNLKQEIYSIDEAIANGYKQTKSNPNIFPDMCSAPEHMDLPTWDNENKKWYDAEY